MLDAFGQNPLVERMIFRDEALIARAEREGKAWASKMLFDKKHYNHVHVDIVAP